MIDLRLCLLFAAATFATAGCSVFKSDLPVGDQVDFERHIKPIIEGRCVKCHNQSSMPDRISFETRELALAPGKHGHAIIPGNPDESRMLNFINAPKDTAEAMPRSRHEVSAEESETIREWIAAGAKWPAGEKGRLRAK